MQRLYICTFDLSIFTMAQTILENILTINTFCKKKKKNFCETPILNSVDTVNIKQPIYCTFYL